VSDFAQSAQDLYRRLFDREIEIITIHAGLECAVFSKKIKGVDAISIGPDMEAVHSTKERLSISSTAREWRYLTELLKL
jgi:dipeptidase D